MRTVDGATAAGERRGPRPTRAQAEPAVVELLRRHGGRLMSVARRYSANREDAEDAYQRAVEILLTRAPSTHAADLLPWMKTVVKHEAFAVARQRARHGAPSEVEQIEPLAGVAASPAELAERRERLRLGAEALRRLKPQEVRALLLRAEGLSYREICAATGWSYTKVNRCLSEGRQSFVERVAGIEAGDECERLGPLLSAVADGEAADEDVAALRPHLRGCLACRARLREYRRAPARAAAVAAPAGAVASVLGWARTAGHGAGGRVHDAGAWVHERGQELAVRFDGVVQAAAAHKLAAVAASAAVLAGGGAATVGVLGQRSAGASRPAGLHASGRAAVGGGAAVVGSGSAAVAGRAHGARFALRLGSRATGHGRRSRAARARRASAPAWTTAPGRSGSAPGGEFDPGPAVVSPRTAATRGGPGRASESAPASGAPGGARAGRGGGGATGGEFAP